MLLTTTFQLYMYMYDQGQQIKWYGGAFILTFYMFISNIKILHLNKKYSLGRENFN
jgi:hypothetical protein